MHLSENFFSLAKRSYYLKGESVWTTMKPIPGQWRPIKRN